MVMSMTVAIIIIAVIFFRFVFFRLAVFYVVQCAKCVYQGLPPVFFKLFLTDSQGVVHCFVQSQLEDENEIFDGLVNICQVFGNILLDGLVAINHILYEHVQIVIFFGKNPGKVDAEHFIRFFRYVAYRSVVSYYFCLVQHGCR